MEGYSDIATIWHWTEPFYRVGPCGLSKFQFDVELLMIIVTNFEFIQLVQLIVIAALNLGRNYHRR